MATRKAAPLYWLIKSEPSVYPFSQLQTEKRTAWTGVRNFEARNNLRAMKLGDLLLYYHSNEGKALVGVATVLASAVADPTAPKEDWASVDVGPVVPLHAPLTLETIRTLPALKSFPLLTRSRLSVAPVSAADFQHVLKLTKTRLPKR